MRWALKWLLIYGLILSPFAIYPMIQLQRWFFFGEWNHRVYGFETVTDDRQPLPRFSKPAGAAREGGAPNPKFELFFSCAFWFLVAMDVAASIWLVVCVKKFFARRKKSLTRKQDRD